MKKLVKKIVQACVNQLRVKRLRKHSQIGNHVLVHKTAKLGQGCKVGSNVIIGENVILGNNVKVAPGVRLERIEVGDNSELSLRTLITGFGAGKIVLGSNTYIGPDTALDFSADLTIGSYVHVAGLSTGLWTHTSVGMCLNSVPLADKSNHHRKMNPIVVEDNVYIGGNCTIYPGVRIGHHSIIAPNSAVTKTVEPYKMAGGVPAVSIKSTKEMIDDDK